MEDCAKSSFRFIICEYEEKEIAKRDQMIENDPSNQVLAVKRGGDVISFFNLKTAAWLNSPPQQLIERQQHAVQRSADHSGVAGSDDDAGSIDICWSLHENGQNAAETISFASFSRTARSDIHFWQISLSSEDISLISSFKVDDILSSFPGVTLSHFRDSFKAVLIHGDRAVYLCGPWLLCTNFRNGSFEFCRKVMEDDEYLIRVISHENGFLLFTNLELYVFSMDLDLELRHKIPLATFDIPASLALGSVLFDVSPDCHTLFCCFLNHLLLFKLSKKTSSDNHPKFVNVTKRLAPANVKPVRSERWQKKLGTNVESMSRKATSFGDGGRASSRASNLTTETGCEVVLLPEEVNGMEIVKMKGLTDGVLLHASNQDKQLLICIKTTDPCIIIHRVPSCCRVLLPKSSLTAPLILDGSSVEGVAFNTSQEHLVNKLMLYSSASSADALCRLNAWDKCSIPMHALQVGLKNRQMDTVAFFLKSRENVFSLPKDGSAKELTEDDLVYNKLDLEQMKEVINVLTSTIASHISDTQSKQFAEQLLVTTLHHLNVVVKGIVAKQQAVKAREMASVAFNQETDRVLGIVTMYIVTLRGFLVRASSCQVPTSLRPPNAFMNQEQERLLAVWESLDQRAATVEGILNGQISLVQSHLSKRYGHTAADIETVIKYGLEETIAVLHERDMNVASLLLTNMGFDIESKLKDICMHTADRQLRLYLSDYLKANGSLSNEESAMVDYLQELEAVYSCASFETAKSLQVETCSQRWNDCVDLKAQIETPQSESNSQCGEIFPVEAANSKTHAYADILLNWIRHWNANTRSRIIADRVLYQPERNVAAYNYVLPPSVIWEYFCEHLDVERLTQWIRHQFPLESESGANGSLPWPYNLPIMDDMMLMIDRCPSHIKDDLLDLLASRGVLTSIESSSFGLLLRRLSRLNITFSSVKSESSRDAFHRDVIQLTQEKHLTQLLYFYLDHSNLRESAIPDLLTFPILPWVQALLAFHQVASSPLDLSKVFDAGVALHNCFDDSVVSDDLKAMTTAQHIHRLLALLAFSPSHFDQVFADPTALDALCDLRRIQASIANRSQEVSLFQQDISVYQLLQGNAPLDPSRLFGWQSTNSLATQEAPKEMPHFSQPSLVNQYAYKQSLSFTYFLKQGRPCYAFCAFLSQQLSMGVHRLPHKSIQDVCDRATVLAVKNFLLPLVSSACVAFIEMMGGDSAWVRLYLEVAKQLWAHQHACNVIGSNLEKRREVELRLKKRIVSIFLRCLHQHHDSRKEISSLLEAATRWTIGRRNISQTSYDAAKLWMLPYLFTRGHQLPPSRIFLTECAKADNWLMFLTYTQMMQYSVDELRESIEQFSSYHLREHLRLLLEHVLQMDDQRSPSISPTTDPKESRDFRAQLYAKIGLHQTQVQMQESTSSEDDSDNEKGNESDATSGKNVEELLPADFSANTTFLEVILRCEQQPTPWRSLCAACIRLSYPELAVVAKCYEKSQTLTCLCVWLTVSASPLTLRPSEFKLLETRFWDVDSLLDISRTLIERSLHEILLRGLQIFQPTNTAIICFLRFYSSILRFEHPDVITNLLSTFHEDYLKLRREPAAPLQLPLAWVESVASCLIVHFLKTQDCRLMIRKFLKHLDQHNSTRLFGCKVLNIELLHKIHCVAGHFHVPLSNIALGGDQQSQEYLAACQQVLTDLEKLTAFQEARVFAALTNQDVDVVSIHELRHELDVLRNSHTWNTTDTREQFWRHCHDHMKRHQTDALDASAFFQEQAEATTHSADKTHILQLALLWLSDDQHVERRHKVFCQLWRSKIQHCLQSKPQNSQPSKSKTEWTIDKETLLRIRHLRDASSSNEAALEEEEIKSLDALIGDLLDSGQIGTAREVVAHFDYNNQHLDIISSCVLMARGLLRPDSLDFDLKKLMASAPVARKLRRMSSTTLVSLPSKSSLLSVVSQAQMAIETDWEEVGEVILSTIRSLSQHCSAGSRCVQFVVTAYQISVALLRSFDWVLQTETFAMLHVLLCSEVRQRFVLAKSFLLNSGISDEQVSGYFSEVVLRELKVLSGLSSSPANTSDESAMILKGGFDANRTLAGTRSSSCMTDLIQLCNDPAVMGQRLLEMVISLHSLNAEVNTQSECGQPSILAKVMKIEVELLVYAHDCFTLACHMEGVSSLLTAARSVTMALSQAKQYNLMVHLLTGVARYSEMTYIFELLKENHQFESLFMKGIARDNQLRVAVMDYLNRYHQEDRDLQKVVSFRFARFREIATLLCEDAHRTLRSLATERVLDNNSSTQQSLQLALDALNDASESFAKESCLRHAQQCARQAKMVSLQMQLLATKTKIIGLDRNSLLAFMEKHPKMPEALVVCEAYEQHSLWADALHAQVILNNNHAYLQDFCRHFNLSSSLVADIAAKFQSSLSSRQPKTASASMKKVLSLCTDVALRYQLNSTLGFNEDFNQDDVMAYLKDCKVIKETL